MKKDLIYNWDKIPIVLTTEHISLIFNISQSTVKKWASEGTIPAVKLGKKWVFEKNQIKEIFEKKND